MGLQFSLMATVEAIMAWVVQTENGGLLNAFFRVVSTDTQGGQRVEVSYNVTKDFLLSMFLKKPVPLPLLEAMPESLGGGQAAVDAAHAHPNREADIFWLTVAMFMIAIILIILIQFINCCCSCCCKGRNSHGPLNPLQMTIAKSKLRNKQLVIRFAYLVAMAIAVAFLVVSVILLIVYFSSIALTISYLETNPQQPQNQTPVSLPDGLQATLRHLSAFIKGGLTSGRDLTNSSIDTFINLTYAELSDQLGGTMDSLLLYLRIQNGLNKGNETLMALGATDLYVQSIIDKVDEVKRDLGTICATIEDSKTMFIMEFGNITDCRSDNECGKLRTATENLQCGFKPDDIDTKTLDAFKSQLGEVKVKLTKELGEANSAIEKVRNSTSEMLGKVESQLGLNTISDTLDNFWTDTGIRSDKQLEEFNKTLGSVEQQLPQYVGYIRIGFNVIGGIFIFMLVIAVLIAIRLIYRAIRDGLYGNSALADSKDGKWDKIVCGKASVCTCSVVFMPLLLIFAAIIAVLLFALTVASGEGCIYLVQESALKKTNFVVDGFVAGQWSSLIGDAVGGADGYLDLPPPNNVLLALTQTCQPIEGKTPRGLLSALGYVSIVNVSKVINSSEVQKGIKDGKDIVLKEVQGLNIASKLPNKNDLENVKLQMQDTLDQYNVTELLSLLNTSKLPIDSLEALVTSLKNLAGLGNEGTGLLESAISQMKAIKPKLTETCDLLGGSKDKFTELQQPASATIDALLQSLQIATDQVGVTEEVGRQYDRAVAKLQDSMKGYGGPLFMQLTQNLLPCGDAYAAYNAVTGVTCGGEGGVNRLLGLTYVFALTVLFIAFLYLALFDLAFLQALQIHLLTGAMELVDENSTLDTSTNISSDWSDDKNPYIW